jgi:hypothetical protein
VAIYGLIIAIVFSSRLEPFKTAEPTADAYMAGKDIKH